MSHLQKCQFLGVSDKAHGSESDICVSVSGVFFGDGSHKLAAGVHKAFSLCRKTKVSTELDFDHLYCNRPHGTRK